MELLFERATNDAREWHATEELVTTAPITFYAIFHSLR